MKAKQREAQQGIAKPSIAEHIKPHYSTADDSIGKHSIGKQIKANMEQHQPIEAEPNIAKQILAWQGIAKLNNAEQSKAKRSQKEAKHGEA